MFDNIHNDLRRIAGLCEGSDIDLHALNIDALTEAKAGADLHMFQHNAQTRTMQSLREAALKQRDDVCFPHQTMINLTAYIAQLLGLSAPLKRDYLFAAHLMYHSLSETDGIEAIRLSHEAVTREDDPTYHAVAVVLEFQVRTYQGKGSRPLRFLKLTFAGADFGDKLHLLVNHCMVVHNQAGHPRGQYGNIVGYQYHGQPLELPQDHAIQAKDLVETVTGLLDHTYWSLTLSYLTLGVTQYSTEPATYGSEMRTTMYLADREKDSRTLQRTGLVYDTGVVNPDEVDGLISMIRRIDQAETQVGHPDLDLYNDFHALAMSSEIRRQLDPLAEAFQEIAYSDDDRLIVEVTTKVQEAGFGLDLHHHANPVTPPSVTIYTRNGKLTFSN